MSKVIIDNREYEIIEGTQSDGRCFSASIFYDLYKSVATDDVLNKWIQYYIIDPILQTETTNCPQFVLWVINWIGIHNANYENSSYVSNNSGKINLPDQMSQLQELFNGLNIIKAFITSSNNVSNNIDIVNELLVKLNTLISKHLDASITKLRDIIASYLKNNQPYTKESTQIVLTYAYNTIEQLQLDACNNYTSTEDYKLVVDKYKQYIKSLNQPITHNGKSNYEWTDPNVGPINVLLNMDTIKSIQIYNSSSTKFEEFTNNKNKGEDIYLYYQVDIHYKPLILIGGN